DMEFQAQKRKINNMVYLVGIWGVYTPFVGALQIADVGATSVLKGMRHMLFLSKARYLHLYCHLPFTFIFLHNSMLEIEIHL
ncbi:hypothetical protein ACJX0J_018346, partial [Zea mays]